MSNLLEQYDAAMERNREGARSEAIDALKKITEEHPEFALAYNALGALLKKNDRLDQAVQCAEKYCELEPEDPFGFSILSSYCIAAGLREKAEEALGRAQDLRFKAHFADRDPSGDET